MNGSDKKRAYDAILQDIIRGTFHEEKVLNERSLIERYQIGRAPVREALVELCNEHVLRSIPRYGYEILTLTLQDIREVLEYRLILEIACLRKTMDSGAAAAADFQAFVAAIPTSEPVDVWEAWENNERVHLRLISYAQNAYCRDALASSMAILKRAYAQFYWNREPAETRDAFDDSIHRRLAQALLAGDRELAEKTLTEDILSFGSPLIAL